MYVGEGLYDRASDDDLDEVKDRGVRAPTKKTENKTEKPKLAISLNNTQPCTCCTILSSKNYVQLHLLYKLKT